MKCPCATEISITAPPNRPCSLRERFSHTIIQDGRTFCFKAGSTMRSEKVTQCFTQTRLENLHKWRWYTLPRTQVPRPEHPCEGQASPHIQSDPLLTPLMSAVSCLPCTAMNCRSVCEALRCGMEERWQEQDGRFRALCKVSIMANPAPFACTQSL